MHTTHATYRFAPPAAECAGSRTTVLYLYRTPAGGRETVLTRVRGRDEQECAREARRQVRMLRRGGELRGK